MSKLYKELADIYEAMYASFIDYDEEYDFYSKILKTHNKKSVLEIGSGTGNLSKLFQLNNWKYIGLDMSTEMLEIARNKNPFCAFIEGDMRDFVLEQRIDSILITGRSISYLLSNEDVNSTFSSIHRNLKGGGIFCFDFIDANRFISETINVEKVIHKATLGDQKYMRESKWRLNMQHGMDLIWDSIYSRKVKNEYVEIGKDKAVVRPFTKNEIEIFLEINGFKIRAIIDRKNYAFPTYVIVAEKQL